MLALAPVAGMLAGWGLAASAVNLAAMLVAKGLVRPGATANRVGLLLLGVAAGQRDRSTPVAAAALPIAAGLLRRVGPTAAQGRSLRPS